jgi:hypothetical protein
MRYLIISLALVLAGCQSVPVVPKWPDVPKELLTACPDLKTIDPTNDKLSTVVDVVADNYKEYYDCKAQVDNWIQWYDGQQKIWKTLK